jgi:hypothetical protein
MRSTIWNSACANKPLIDWPPFKEFKTEGDDRVKGHRNYGRKLPLPRLRKLDKAHYHRLETDLKGVPTEGPDVPYGVREIDTNLVSALTDTMPQIEDITTKPAVDMPRHFPHNTEILLNQLDDFTRELIEEIEELI